MSADRGVAAKACPHVARMSLARCCWAARLQAACRSSPSDTPALGGNVAAGGAAAAGAEGKLAGGSAAATAGAASGAGGTGAATVGSGAAMVGSGAVGSGAAGSGADGTDWAMAATGGVGAGWLPTTAGTTNGASVGWAAGAACGAGAVAAAGAAAGGTVWTAATATGAATWTPPPLRVSTRHRITPARTPAQATEIAAVVIRRGFPTLCLVAVAPPRSSKLSTSTGSAAFSSPSLKNSASTALKCEA